MKTIIILSTLLLTGCFDPVDKQVAFVYPREGVARLRTFVNKCPLKTTEAKTVPLTDLQGWCAVPPETCAEIAREYESKECK